jgi:hypothetical protein
VIGVGEDVGDPEGDEPALGESLMVRVGDEVLVEELWEAELDEESEEQGDVIDAFVSQLDGGGGGIHGSAPTKPWAWKRLGCTVADGSGGRSRRDTCKHGENGQYR